MHTDKYTKEVLKENYILYKDFVEKRYIFSKQSKISIRSIGFPEDISENIIKFIIHSLGDTSSKWKPKKGVGGDLFSDVEGKQECKSFTSNGPISFSPTPDWNVLYLLDARKWLNNKVVLYKVTLQSNSKEWNNIQINTTQTFDHKCAQGRRPHVTWAKLFPQIS